MDARYRKQYKYRRYQGIPTSLVPADQARAHINRMLELGWSANALEQMAGGRVTSTTLMNLAYSVHPTIERTTQAAVLSIPITLAPTPHVDDRALIPAQGAERRVRALMRIGWTHDAMRAECRIETAHLARGTYPTTVVRKWRAIDDMYQRLCMRRGPSMVAADRACRAGFAPPLAWNDIDDPGEEPNGWRRGVLDRAVELRDLDAQRVGITEACRRLGASREAIERWCARHDMTPLYGRLVDREQGRYWRNGVAEGGVA
jgi:hypothetical protein